MFAFAAVPVTRSTARARNLLLPSFMTPANDISAASVAATARAEGREGVLSVVVGGSWRLQAERPEVKPLLRAVGAAAGGVKRVVIEAESLGSWDSSLVLFLLSVREWAAERKLPCAMSAMPAAVEALIRQFDDVSDGTEAPERGRVLLTTRLGLLTTARVAEGRVMLRFLGECVLGFLRVLGRPFAFRWGDCVEQMRRSGAAALPIVGLISALVGVILAFVAAVQLRQFGADIFVANLIGLSVFREMGPMMAAIVLTGRTGAAFAAELGNMKLGEEIDALETFGVRAHDFLVMPRMVALVCMMPMLALYADCLGVLGGMGISQLMLDIAPAGFFAQLQTAVSLSDINTGLFKSVFFGFIVAFSGCYRGMQAERSSVGVGQATTQAVVMGILLIIVSDAIFTVIFNILEW